MDRRIFFPGIAAVTALALFVWQGDVLFSQSRNPGPATVDDSTASLRIRFGATDSAPLPWDGSLSVANGEVLALRDWHPRPENRISGKSAWVLSTLKGPNFVRRPVEEEQIEPPEPYLLQAGLIVDVKSTTGTRIDFQTRQGSFQVMPARIQAGSAAQFLNGRVVVDRVPSAQKISTDDHQGDFATMLSGNNGEVWVAWVAYRDNANEIFARRFDGSQWGPAQKIAERSDVYLVKMGRDGAGRPWAVWSAQVNNNWDLYGSRFDGGAWSSAQRLTDAAGPDIYQNLATDSSGKLWLVWQGFRDGQSDIFARSYDGSSWSDPVQVSSSKANEWEPAIAADRIGNVYVAWDTYEKGNYDVMMRKFSNGKWGDIAAIADTPKFEAHPSLVCDSQNRLWAAWNESGFQWGKDAGFLLTKQATALYRSRWMSVAVYTGARWEEPVAGLERSLPAGIQGYNDLPNLQLDSSGRVWIFFRHRVQRMEDTPSTSINHRAAWEIWGVSYEGARWSEPLFIPFSQGRTDTRGGFASDGRGRMYAGWSTDNRDFAEFLFQRSDVYAGRLPRVSGARPEPKLKPRIVPTLRTWAGHSGEAADIARIRSYTVQSGGKTYHIHRGDTHRHTEFSFDGHNDGSLLDGYRYALDAAALDFLGISDHNNLSGPDLEYVNWIEQQAADVFMLEHSFVPLCAYERSVVYPNGHRNVLFAVRGHPTLPTPREEAQGKLGARSLYEYLRRLKGIAIPHTSAGTMGTDWRDNGAEVEPLVEIYQGDRVSAEYEGAPKAAYDGNPSMQPGGFRPLGYVWNAWEKGYKLGVQASSDHISTHISYACTLAEDFSRQGLIDAMRQRHSYGATDNIILDYRLQADGVEYIQGDIGGAAGPVRLSVNVIGTRPIRQIDIIKNNTFVYNRQPMAKEVNFTFADNVPAGPKESYYYVRVIQVDDQMAWSSPIWIRRK